MAAGLSARLRVAQGRRFGLTVGGAFLLMAGVAWWRAHPAVAAVLSALGLTLSACGVIVPTLLGPVERAWMALAHLISRVTTPVVMGLMYLIVLTPVGVARRLLGGNPLVHVARDSSYWKARPENKRASDLTRQF